MSESKQTEPTKSGHSKWEDFHPIGGLIYGGTSFILTFILTVVYFIAQVQGETSDIESIGVMQAVGWPFYKAHGISPQFIVEGETFDYFAQIDVINPLILTAIPAVVLLASGYVVARRVESPLSPESSAVAGSSLVVGYLPLFVFLAPLFHVERPGVTVGPKLGVTGILLGTVFAAGFGAVGGYLYGR